MPIDPDLREQLERTEAGLIRGEVTVPAQVAVHGLTDAQLWDLIDSGGNVLAGLTFAQAVATDPRRVEAQIHQRIHEQFYAALEAGRGGMPAQLARAAYLLRAEALRSVHGRIDAPLLLDSMEQNWEYYSRILAVARVMATHPDPRRRRREASHIFDIIQRNQAEIYRGFREGAEIAMRAAHSAPNEAAHQAWFRMAQIIRDMWLAVVSELTEMGTPLLLGDRPEPEEWFEIQPVEEENEEFGSLHDDGIDDGLDSFGSEWSKYMSSGHRAPGHAFSLGYWRRAGGRFYA